MKFRVMVVLLIATGLAQAQQQLNTNDGGSQIDDSKTFQADAVDGRDADAMEKLSRKKRGVAPVVGTLCEHGYKLIGDDCVVANIPFE
ncbi:hypothetical protein BGP84_14395 [Pseudomonas putida]|uniref:Uncharacterized protein n=1 Tax=Pseudomonas putida TaxID=303 RepID=A0A2S3X5N0_PSEPU|nr:hypothetical protein [Pseudomonas putida]POG10864.1 hypothetical protein BGP84_14395 [Pseudomonas putida]POG15227.1 hypothetical protein BGP85_03335 [Pseudomonas putida]